MWVRACNSLVLNWFVIRPIPISFWGIPMIGTASPPRFEFQTIPRNKVYQAVAKQLERRITEELKPGDRLPPERELGQIDRKSTRLNSSHLGISYAVFCLK